MFIKDLYAISPQSTHDLQFEDGVWHEHQTKCYPAIEPNYLNIIPANLLRRMGKAVRMGIGAGLPILLRNEKTDGIIIGTANGGLEDCIHFLNQIVDYEEGVLTPTNFVQSTPNALAGQLALMTKNTGYNITHVNGALSFENALLDGKMFFEEQNSESSLLIGAVEEISEYNYNIDFLADRYKEEIVPNAQLLFSKTKGTICGEGASMFVVSNSNENALAEIVDIAQVTSAHFEDLVNSVLAMLKKNNINSEDLDLLILGYSGDSRTDNWYEKLHTTLFENKPAVGFKNMVGDYRTASAFAIYFGVQLLNGVYKNKEQIVGTIPSKLNYILIYNHFDGLRHGITLLKK